MKNTLRWPRLLLSIFGAILLLLAACDVKPIDDNRKSGMTYVKPSIDSRGRYRKGHVRKSVSLKSNAYKSQARSRYYYQTRGKYRRKK